MQIFRRSTEDDRKNNLELCTGVWGLIPNNGTYLAPHLLPSDSKFSSSPHYKMFNARSETIYDKRSFSGLIRNGQSCILAVDGYYEWTKPLSSSSDKRKQPYFVRNKDKQQPLLLAGIWSCVKTGRRANGSEEMEMLTTFTILTMDAHPDQQWLHPRQPVLIWDISIALEWILQPSPSVLTKLLRIIPHNKDVNDSDEKRERELLVVYPVSKSINDGKYQGADCTAEVKVMEVPSLKSYFSPKKTKIEKISPTEPKAVVESHSTPNFKEVTHDDPPHGGPNLKSYFSPRKANTEKVVEGSIGPEPLLDVVVSLAALEGGTVQKYSQSQSNGVTPTETPSHALRNERRWTCSQCTYIHIGAMKFNYLACEVCGSPRIITDTVERDVVYDDDDGGRKRKTIS